MHTIGQVIECAHTTRSNDGYGERITHCACQLQIKTRFGTVAIHAGQQDFTRAVIGHLTRPLQGIQPRILAAAMAIDIPTLAARGNVFRRCAALGIYRNHDALRTIPVCRITNHLRIGNGRRIETGLVGPRIQKAAHIFQRAHAATHRQRDKNLAGHRFNDVQDQVTAVAGGGNVQKRQLVGALLVVSGSHLDGIARIAQANEIDALDHTATGYVQTGNDAFG